MRFILPLQASYVITWLFLSQKFIIDIPKHNREGAQKFHVFATSVIVEFIQYRVLSDGIRTEHVQRRPVLYKSPLS